MSMSNDELQQLLLATFADQAKEQLQTINERLLALEEADVDIDGLCNALVAAAEGSCQLPVASSQSEAPKAGEPAPAEEAKAEEPAPAPAATPEPVAEAPVKPAAKKAAKHKKAEERDET